jgi:hypothetical protein
VEGYVQDSNGVLSKRTTVYASKEAAHNHGHTVDTSVQATEVPTVNPSYMDDCSYLPPVFAISLFEIPVIRIIALLFS